MGVVYRATDLRLERPVALELIAPELASNEGFRKRFLRESTLAASAAEAGLRRAGAHGLRPFGWSDAGHDSPLPALYALTVAPLAPYLSAFWRVSSKADRM